MGVLVGAHPRLGELIAEEVLKRGLLRNALTFKNGFEIGPVDHIDETKKSSPKKPSPKKRKLDATIENGFNTSISTGANMDKNSASQETKTISLSRQVTLGDSRIDFQMTLTDPHKSASPHRVLFEVKNVVCADYKAGEEPIQTGPGHCVVLAPPTQDGCYKRAAIFPWGRTRGQKFEGQSVVSERACKHLRNLQSLRNKDVTSVVLFIVNRSDCQSVRACHEKCPVFAQVLEDVVKSGVKALAVRVRWTEDGDCFFNDVVPVSV